MHRPELSRVSTAEIAEDDYFSTNAPPSDITKTSELAKDFVAKHLKEGRRVVLVTSGGTTVPLENQTVRFIDNFSAGTRGATSAEYFLEHGYAVIFLHRRFSLLPYSRHYSHSTNCFLDYMSQDENGRVYIKDEYQRDMQAVLQKYQAAKDKDLLLLLSFTTITEYLWSLREVAFALQPMESSAVLYLAAAVSDFFIPKDRLAEHKIQSSNPNDEEKTSTEQSKTASYGKKLVIDLDPVPKFLKRLVDGWAPHAMIISFKLETDPSLLIAKAKAALDRYSHHLVIGNLLATRSYEVVLVTKGQEEWIRIPSDQFSKRTSTPPSDSHIALVTSQSTQKSDLTGSFSSPFIEIEALIVPEVIKLQDSIMTSQTY
ncbi:hypothetical protein MMC10_008895 [Thelotrema lepadinum]|nr:hypothetical protein [Thelotrema lepadinum]